MSVYFRTGRNSGASVSWWFYFLFVLPVQVLYWFAKYLVLAFVWLGALMVAAGRFARDGLRRHRPTS